VEEGKGEGGFTFALAAIYTSPRAGPPRPSRRAKSSRQNMARGGEEGGGEEGEGGEGEGEEGEGEEGEGAAWHFYRVYIQASPKRASIHLIGYSAFL
jgi:hypothetical protein